MPFALVIIGLVLIVTGAKDTYRELGSELTADFTGPGNFIYWVVSIGAVGSLGYVPAFRDFSRLFLGLIVLAMVLANRGFFAQFGASLTAGPLATEATPRVPAGTPAGQSVNTAQGVGIPPSNSNASANFAKVLEAAKLFAKFASMGA